MEVHTGYRVYSVLTGENEQVRDSLPRMEPRTCQAIELGIDIITFLNHTSIFCFFNRHVINLTCVIHLTFQQKNNQQLVPEGTVGFAPKLKEEKNNIPILAPAETLNRVTPFPLLVQSNSLFCPVTQLNARVASSETAEPSPSSRSHTQPLKEEEEEEVHEGNISISSVYSQG